MISYRPQTFLVFGFGVSYVKVKVHGIALSLSFFIWDKRGSKSTSLIMPLWLWWLTCLMSCTFISVTHTENCTGLATVACSCNFIVLIWIHNYWIADFHYISIYQQTQWMNKKGNYLVLYSITKHPWTILIYVTVSVLYPCLVQGCKAHYCLSGLIIEHTDSEGILYKASTPATRHVVKVECLSHQQSCNYTVPVSNCVIHTSSTVGYHSFYCLFCDKTLVIGKIVR